MATASSSSAPTASRAGGDLLFGHAVRRQLVGVEDAARAVALRVVGQFRAEPTVRLDLAPDESVEAEQGNRGDLPARVERAANNPGLGVGEGVGHVAHVADARVALDQFVADFEQFGLPTDLAADDVLDPLEVLYALHFDAGAVGDGDVHVLPIVPSPRLTAPVDRSSMPMRSAASRAPSGLRMSGPVPISTRGTPSRSSE